MRKGPLFWGHLVLCWMRKAHLFWLDEKRPSVLRLGWSERARARAHTHTLCLSRSGQLITQASCTIAAVCARGKPCLCPFRQATRSFRGKERDLPLSLWCTIPLVLVHKTAEPCS
jgi:hypothetical protein